MKGRSQKNRRAEEEEEEAAAAAVVETSASARRRGGWIGCGGASVRVSGGARIMFQRAPNRTSGSRMRPLSDRELATFMSKYLSPSFLSFFLSFFLSLSLCFGSVFPSLAARIRSGRKRIGFN